LDEKKLHKNHTLLSMAADIFFSGALHNYINDYGLALQALHCATYTELQWNYHIFKYTQMQWF